MMSKPVSNRERILARLRGEREGVRMGYVRAFCGRAALYARHQAEQALLAEEPWAAQYCQEVSGLRSWRERLEDADAMLRKRRDELRRAEATLAYAEKHLPEET